VTSRDLLTPAFYYWKPAFLAFIVPVILAVIVALLATPVFTAQTRLLILPGDDYIFRGSAVGDGAVQTFDRAQIVNAEMEILKSKDLQEQAVRVIGLGRVYPGTPDDRPGMDQALEKLGGDLTIENVPASNVIDLRFRHQNPQISAELLNTLVDLYVKRRREIFGRSDVKAILDQEADLRARLTGVEAEVSQLSANYRIGDYNQELIAVQTRQTALIGQVETVDQQISEAGGREKRLGTDLRSTAPVVTLNTDWARSQQVQALTTALTTAQEQRRVAAARYRDGHPLVAELDRQIAGLEGAIAATPQQETALVRQGVNPVYQDLDTQLSTTRGQAAGLKAGRDQAVEALNANTARLAELIDIGPRYRELLRNRALLEGSYQDIARRSEDVRLKEALAGSRANVRIVERAEPPTKGTTGRMIILAAGLVLGAAAALAVIVVSAATSQVMVSPEEAEDKLDLPVLVTVPYGPDDAPRTPLWRPMPGRMTPDDVNVLHRLVRSIAGERGGLVQWLSASEGEGVTTLAMDMAVLRSQRSGGRVLLVDVEPAEGQSLASRLHHRGARLDPVDNAQGIYRVDHSALYVTGPMSAGGGYRSDEQWSSFLATARQDFVLTILDSPAVQRSSAGVLVSALVDITLLVVEAEETRAPVVESLVRRIEGAGGAVFGVVLNKRRFYIPKFIYRRL
jgi:succinoglycan biosynthesis transport protein ExoP